jgi:hypothetical protein
MDIEGRPQPVGGQHTRVQIGEGLREAPEPDTELSRIVPQPDASDVADVVGGPVLPYLTPDAMLVYCQSRLTGINTQCRDIMTRQETNAKAQAAIGDVLTTLDRFQDVSTNGEQQAVIRAAYTKAIDEVGGPDSSLGQQLAKDLNTLLNKGEKNDIASLINAAKNHQSELNSDAEIDMIRLQSLMSQRQTAIQLTTNIVQSLNDQANKIVANIGH